MIRRCLDLNSIEDPEPLKFVLFPQPNKIFCMSAGSTSTARHHLWCGPEYNNPRAPKSPQMTNCGAVCIFFGYRLRGLWYKRVHSWKQLEKIQWWSSRAQRRLRRLTKTYWRGTQSNLRTAASCRAPIHTCLVLPPALWITRLNVLYLQFSMNSLSTVNFKLHKGTYGAVT